MTLKKRRINMRDRLLMKRMRLRERGRRLIGSKRFSSDYSSRNKRERG